MTKQLTVVTKQPGQRAETRTVEYHDYHDLAKLIKIGDFEMLEVVPDGPPGLDLWANEEGKYASERVVKDLGNGVTSFEIVYPETNLSIFGGQDYVMGPVFVAASDSEGETRSLEPMEVDIAIEWLNQHAVGPIAAARGRALAAQFR